MMGNDIIAEKQNDVINDIVSLDHKHVRRILEMLGDIIPIEKKNPNDFWTPFRFTETFKKISIYIMERESGILSSHSISSRVLYKELVDIRNEYLFLSEGNNPHIDILKQSIHYSTWFGEILDYIRKNISMEVTSMIVIKQTTDELAIQGVIIGSWQYNIELVVPKSLDEGCYFIIKTPIGGNMVKIPIANAEYVKSF